VCAREREKVIESERESARVGESERERERERDTHTQTDGRAIEYVCVREREIERVCSQYVCIKLEVHMYVC